MHICMHACIHTYICMHVCTSYVQTYPRSNAKTSMYHERRYGGKIMYRPDIDLLPGVEDMMVSQ